VTTIIDATIGPAVMLDIGEDTVEAARQAGIAALAADRAELADAAAESLVGPTYASTAAGLAATAEDGGFAVDNGDGTVTIYREVSGVAVEQRRLATSAALAAPDGAERVGFQAGSAARSVAGKLGDVVSVKDFGATGDGTTNDYAAIVLARTEALASGKVLFFPDGEYAFGTTLNFGVSGLQVQFGKVVLKPTHAGVGISFDAGASPALVFGVQFGWGNPPTVQGNASTTDAIYVRSCHHMKVDVRIRDCVTGMRVHFSVLSEFKINHSSNQGGWTILDPTNGLIVDRRETAEATTACRFDLCIEGMSGMGVILTAAQHCDFWGTSEGNGAGGVSLASDSINNNFHNFFCEQNGTAPHWTIGSSSNIFFNCAGGGPSNTGTNTSIITGTRNLFVRGKWHNLTSGGFYNEFRQTVLSGTFSSDANDILERCHDGAGAEIADKFPGSAIINFTPKGSWVGQTAGNERAHGYFKDKSGVVHFLGAVKSGTGSIFDMPVGFRPGGTIYRPYYSVTAGTSGVIAITAGGDLQHISGDTGTVDLSEMSYLAEA
jgi:hypothetical protein